MAVIEVDKKPVTGAGPFNGVLTWIDRRFPLVSMWREHAADYWAPKNFNFWYYFGSLALLVLVIQIVTGIFLTMNYKPDAKEAFASVEYIMREVNWGWWIRYMHSTGASFFFICVYLHMFRGLLYGSYRRPRELVWMVGMLIFLSLMAEAFFGYLLPWGQMSYWGAQVIVNLFDAIPVIGPKLAIWIRGDYVVSDATLNRFFAFHVIAVPLVLLGLVVAHLLALHEVGSNNPDGIDIKGRDPKTGHPIDSVAFHPYYTVKDSFGASVFLVIFFVVVFFLPEMGGYFLESNNFIPADPLKTPPHIAPVWYFTPFYSILRATTDNFVYFGLIPGVVLLALAIIVTVPRTAVRVSVAVLAALLLAGFLGFEAKVWGVVLMGVSVLIYFFLPWLDRSPVRSIRYKGPFYKIALALFVVAFFMLGYLGTQPVSTGRTVLAQVCTAVYFLFFAVMPWYSRFDKTQPEPERVTWK
ncbi:MAG TPA: cytochrome b N-terminal domain-containing protein [Burkholderiales bacterium]|nr:cytochrome b N-terminal domain-containing protein [Burkholderiales bacterium]